MWRDNVFSPFANLPPLLPNAPHLPRPPPSSPSPTHTLTRSPHPPIPSRREQGSRGLGDVRNCPNHHYAPAPHGWSTYSGM
jgi:hypothetical protein